MSIILGIDAGISSTKIIGIENGKRIMSPIAITSSNTMASIYGAVGSYLQENKTSLGDIEHIMVTGIGGRELKGPIHDCPTSYVDEFKANGLGARFQSGLDSFIVVSMGTGTSLVRVDGDEITHIGGIGMGGGTLLGLSRILLGVTDIQELHSMVNPFGDADRVNLTINDITDADIDGLIGMATASLFGKAQDYKPSQCDIAAGLIHMVFETIGSCAVLSQINGGLKDFVLIGGLTELVDSDIYDKVIYRLEQLYHVNIHIPKEARFCTALGAVLSYKYENE